MLNAEDLHNLEALVGLSAIHQCAGKKKAAEEQGISVETLNKQIEELERNLNLKLVTDKGRSCALTSAGLLVLDNIRPAIEIWKQFDMEKQNRHDISGLVRVGVDVSVAPTFVPTGMTSIFEKYPALGLDMVSMVDVEKDSADCDICITREPIVNVSDFALIHQRQVRCGYFASSEYLSQHGYPVDLNEMAKNHRLVIRYNTKIYDDDFKRVLKKSANVKMVSSNSAAIVELVRSGAGIGVMPLYFKNEGLVCLDNLICNTQIMYYLTAKKRLKDIPRVRLVLDYYKEAMGEMH